jgi:two-component system, chemotaxis family, chemotaxis protein CheY
MLRILVVDDEDAFRALLIRVLSAHGYEVREARDGQEALTVYAEFPADVVVLDIFMPRKEGLETIKELRQLAPQVKIVVVTGGWDQIDMNLLDVAKKLGADEALQKPFRVEALLAAIARTQGK